MKIKVRCIFLKRGTTIFLKVTLVLLAIPFLVLGYFLPSIMNEIVDYWPKIDYLHYPALLGAYGAIAAYFAALFQSFKLLDYIEKDIAFSDLSVLALKRIKHCAVVIAALFTLEMPMLYYMGETDDAPGVILFGLVIVFASIVIAVFAAVLQGLLKNAIDIKSENDLTV